jgi:hypothetical protein
MNASLNQLSSILRRFAPLCDAELGSAGSDAPCWPAEPSPFDARE